MSSSAVLLLFLVIATAAVGVLAGVLLTGRRRPAPAPDLGPLIDATRADQHRLVEGVLSAAAARLDDRLVANGRELDLREHAIDERVEARNVEVGEHLRELRGQLDGMTRAVHDLREERARQHGEFVTHLAEAAETQQQLAKSASGLRDALANPKARGSWGERTADDLLRHVGFIEGINYRRQCQTVAGTLPDFTFMLPEGRELNMDVKFPADNYLRFLEADTDIERERFRKQFLSDVRSRLKELDDRSYIDPERTVDYLLLFIPNESIYSFIHEQDPELVDVALRRKVMLCSPITLFGVLAVIRQAVDLFRLEQRGDEIHRCLLDFSKQWEKFGGSIDDVEKKLASLNTAFSNLATTRRNQLQRQVDRIAELEPPEESSDPDQPMLVLADERYVGHRDAG
ncbi:MAG TPA: DNA recombination protein RmuC [Microthrixaceae bacterium]|nr:DNA recombination protein RmuC [Microthrixaceae bacterium]